MFNQDPLLNCYLYGSVSATNYTRCNALCLLLLLKKKYLSHKSVVS
jgi:hypothetical protein